ncbi:hypothetical protein AB4485_21835, partial [Vibrio cyclitrophicus]
HVIRYVFRSFAVQFYQSDIAKFITEFQSKNSPTDRYASFDYCYHYFRNTSSEDILKDTEKSCLVIGFYLASWGMLRGSSFLLNHSVKYYEPLVKYIASLDESVWNIDVHNYTNENVEIILSIYQGTKELLIKNGNSDLTLVTKILLGVFGFIPAFDRYFCDTFRSISNGTCGYRCCNKKSLGNVHQFYLDNKTVIDKLSEELKVIEFQSGKPSHFNYPKAKIIDMYGFTKGISV